MAGSWICAPSLPHLLLPTLSLALSPQSSRTWSVSSLWCIFRKAMSYLTVIHASDMARCVRTWMARICIPIHELNEGFWFCSRCGLLVSVRHRAHKEREGRNGPLPLLIQGHHWHPWKGPPQQQEGGYITSPGYRKKKKTLIICLISARFTSRTSSGPWLSFSQCAPVHHWHLLPGSLVWVGIHLLNSNNVFARGSLIQAAVCLQVEPRHSLLQKPSSMPGEICVFVTTTVTKKAQDFTHKLFRHGIQWHDLLSRWLLLCLTMCWSECPCDRFRRQEAQEEGRLALQRGPQTWTHHVVPADQPVLKGGQRRSQPGWGECFSCS